MALDLWFSVDVGIGVEASDAGLNAAQHAIRKRCDHLPKHVRRSIDEWRASVGMAPLWGLSSVGETEAFRSIRRRSQNRESQRRRRARLKEATDGTHAG